MTYLSGKTYKRKRYGLYVVFATIFLAVVIFWPSVKKNTYSAVEPAVIGSASVKQSFSFVPEFLRTYFTSRQTLIAHQKELEAQVEVLLNQVAEKNALLKENTTSQGSSSEEGKRPAALLVYPLLQDVTKMYSTILLSKGFKDGVTTGNLVYIKGYQPVCTIKEVYSSSALCLLLTASGITTEGVTSSSSITLSLVGRGGYYMADIVRDTPVTEGEIVYLRSNPKMILGTVRDVTHNNQDTSWHVFVDGAYNPLTSSSFYVQP